MKKIFLTSITAIAICCPVMAATDIASNASSANCTESVLDTTSGTSNLEAKWTANTLNIEWYNGDDKITTTTCNYDGGITMPDEEPEKTGYTFNGWTTRRAAAPAHPQQTGFDLSTFDPVVQPSSYSYINFNGTASTASNTGKKVPSAHSITENGEWAIEFSYGTVKGIARCSLVGSGYTMGQNGEPTDDLNTDGAGYCWCQATGFDGDKDGTYQSVVSSLWAFRDDRGSAERCASYCANNCAYYSYIREALRAGLFRSAQ